MARIGSFPSFVAVNPRLPVNSIQELVAYGRANPGKLEYGHGNSTGQIVGDRVLPFSDHDAVAAALAPRVVPAPLYSSGSTDPLGAETTVKAPSSFGRAAMLRT